MLRTLAALLFALVPGLAMASPPTAGSVHTFVDPTFGHTIVCDHIEEVQAIAGADKPDAKFLELFGTRNARNEPLCAAMVPTGIVVDVRPIGRMILDDKTFYACAVQSDAGGVTFYALYLEFEDIVHA